MKGESIPIVSTSAVSQIMKKHLSAYLVFAKEIQSDDAIVHVSPIDKERTEFLNQFRDCFSESLPSELPPERPEDHAIDIIPGSSPPNRPCGGL